MPCGLPNNFSTSFIRVYLTVVTGYKELLFLVCKLFSPVLEGMQQAYLYFFGFGRIGKFNNWCTTSVKFKRVLVIMCKCFSRSIYIFMPSIGSRPWLLAIDVKLKMKMSKL